MTAAFALLDQLAARGVRVELSENRIVAKPRRAIPPELVRELQEHAREVADALTQRGAPVPRPKRPDAGPGTCIDCGTSLSDGVVIGICFPCRKARNPAAAPIEWPEDEASPVARPAGPFVLEVVRIAPVMGPVRLSPAEVSTNPARTIEATLFTLRRLIDALNAAWPDDAVATQPIADEIADVLALLGRLGATVYVTSTPAPSPNPRLQ
jgi:hypothetical protein